jgi:HSP20 family molecular chaperone IbpA
VKQVSQLQIQKPENHHDLKHLLFGRWKKHVRRIEERAYQIFEERGQVHGHHHEDWLQAERESNSNSTYRVDTSDTSITIVLTAPGFDADHLTVSIVPGLAVIIEGETQRQASGEEEGVTVTELSLQTLFHSIRLPEEADLDAASAEFHGDELRVTAPLKIGQPASEGPSKKPRSWWERGHEGDNE